MSGDERVLATVRGWVEKAASDLQNAPLALAAGEAYPADTAASHAQQGAEEYLKALLVFRGIEFARVHDVVELVVLFKEVWEGRSFNPDEFAIALEQVVANSAPQDYRDPEQCFSRTSFKAMREAVALEEVPPQQPGANELESDAPLIVFATDSRQKVLLTSLSSSYPPRYAAGDSVPVLHEANRPHQARIRSFHDLRFMPSVPGGLGSVFTAVEAGLPIFGVPA